MRQGDHHRPALSRTEWTRLLADEHDPRLVVEAQWNTAMNGLQRGGLLARSNRGQHTRRQGRHFGNHAGGGQVSLAVVGPVLRLVATSPTTTARTTPSAPKGTRSRRRYWAWRRTALEAGNRPLAGELTFGGGGRSGRPLARRSCRVFAIRHLSSPGRRATESKFDPGGRRPRDLPHLGLAIDRREGYVSGSSRRRRSARSEGQAWSWPDRRWGEVPIAC